MSLLGAIALLVATGIVGCLFLVLLGVFVMRRAIEYSGIKSRWDA